MKFSIRFKIGNRYGAGSIYSTRDICLSIVDRYSLKEEELCTIFTLVKGGIFFNTDLMIKRIS